MTFTVGNLRYEEQYDELNDVYGCIDEKKEMVRCWKCEYAECEMRGKHRDEDEE